MRVSDYHLHTDFSFDSREKMENVCEKAIAEGLSEICFTEHYEFGADDAPWCDNASRDAEINRLVDLYGDRLTILKGVESGQPYKEPEREKELFGKIPFDFVIGSVHMVSDTGRPSKYDFREDNYINYFKMYFEESKLLAEKQEYDVMGHVTFPFRYVSEELLRKYPIESFKKDYLELFDIVISRGKGIEVNTSGYRTPLKVAMPHLEIVKWYKDLGGKIITVGSDGHSANSAFLYVKEGYEMLKEIGYKETAHYRNRILDFEPID